MMDCQRSDDHEEVLPALCPCCGLPGVGIEAVVVTACSECRRLLHLRRSSRGSFIAESIAEVLARGPSILALPALDLLLLAGLRRLGGKPTTIRGLRQWLKRLAGIDVPAHQLRAALQRLERERLVQRTGGGGVKGSDVRWACRTRATTLAEAIQRIPVHNS